MGPQSNRTDFPYKKRERLQGCSDTEERPCEDMAKRLSSVSEEEGLHREQNLPAP